MQFIRYQLSHLFQPRFWFVSALLFISPLLLNAQTLHGVVYITGTATAIANASVYYNASTTGTATNSNGEFTLPEKTDRPPLVISCVGYNTISINNYDTRSLLKVYLTPKIQVLHDVVIGGSDGMSRKDKEKMFLEVFLGTSSFAKGCTITNLKDVTLIYHKSTQTLNAACDTPLQIDNKRLGYHISYFLQEFSYSIFATYFSGNYFYKDNFLPADQDKVFKNRETAYKGSRLEFIRALWADKLEEKGFELYYGNFLVDRDSVLRSDSSGMYIDNKNKILTVLYRQGPTDIVQRVPILITNTGYYAVGIQWLGGNMADQRIGDNLPFEYWPKGEEEENASILKKLNAQRLAKAKKLPAINPITNTAAQANDKNAAVFFEKAYLHTDREVYGQGEDIWYKAYVVNARDNSTINYSHNLYVELIGPGAKLVKREMVRLENGLGNGDFKLAESIPDGNYRLRAYTNWMRNFGDNFIFEKNITVLHTAKSIGTTIGLAAKNKKSANASPATATSTSTPTVRFFPEGGSMVEGISSIIGVKAEDGYGRGIAATGTVISSSGDTIAHFKCDSLGIGLLALLPGKGQTYHAVVDLAGRKPNAAQNSHLIFNLPAALGKGLTLQIKQADSVLQAVINSSRPVMANTISIGVKHGGKTQFNVLLQLHGQQSVVKFPTATLPEGISTITVYDDQGKPECERLVYVHHSGNEDAISVATGKKAFRPKEQVTINIKTLPNANLSLAAVNAAAIPVRSENILSYLNLQSEIKGHIENPARYFDTTNINRFKQLDQLLLTQGWRDFVWRRIEDTTLKLSHQPEQGITLTGRVRRVGADKGLPGIVVNARAPNAEGDKLFSVVTDSTGRFAIYNTKFYGYQYISFASRQEGKVKEDGGGKGNSGGYIQVDSLLRDTLTINPVVTILPDTLPSVADFMNKLNIPLDHQLKEVQIKSRKFAPEIHNIDLSEQKSYDNVMQYLLYTIPGARYPNQRDDKIVDLAGNMIKRLVASNGTGIGIRFYYADGTPIEPDIQRGQNPLDIQMKNVLNVTINKAISIKGDIVYSATLKLRPGSMDINDYFDDTTADMVGYYRARVFYKPNPENFDAVTDPRTNTIHWEPNITTNAKGEATITYNNTNTQGNIKLIVEGITTNGTPMTTTAVYEVK